MNPRLAHRLVRLYPAAWKARYGPEFEALLEAGPGNLRTIANVSLAALSERVFPTLGGNMNPNSQTFSALTRRPSAFLPIAMSLLAFAVMLVGPTIFGDLHTHDEGPTAHLWQILIVGQIPLVAFFAWTWLRRAPKQAFRVLALHAGAVLANVAMVFYLGVG